MNAEKLVYKKRKCYLYLVRISFLPRRDSCVSTLLPAVIAVMMLKITRTRHACIVKFWCWFAETEMVQ